MRFIKAFLFTLLLLSPWASYAQDVSLPETDLQKIAQQKATEELKATAAELEAAERDAEIVQELLELRGESDGEPSKKSQYISLYSNTKIERFIQMYTNRKRDAFGKAIERSAVYMPMIDRIFEQYDLPPNLAYLAVVESNFNPRARSHANAVGLWQFMRYTGRHFDLDNSWWHDDRYDPEKSTIAAAKYLTQLYKQFGQWELALASYNAGGGRVRREIRKARRAHRDTDYWSLKLPRETRGYVPSFYAVNILFENLESYGFDPSPEWRGMPKRDFLDVPGGVSLNQIASAIQVERKVLKELNPNIPRGLTPANVENFQIAVPYNLDYDPESIKSLEQNRKRFWKYHRVRRGDNLWSISRKYGIPLHEMVAFNNLNRRKLLRIGQKILLPVAEDYKFAAHRPKPFSKKKGFTYHRVREGETLWSISMRYNVTLRAIKRWNRKLARKRHLKVGSVVAVKTS